MIKTCFFEACESKKHGINELCFAISYATVYDTIHFAIAPGKLVAEESGVVKSQSAAEICFKPADIPQRTEELFGT